MKPMELFEVELRPYMRTHPRAVSASDRLHVVQAQLARHGIDGLPVLDDQQRPVGVITQSDLLRLEAVPAVTGGAERRLMLPDLTVGEAMTKSPVTLAVDATLATAAAIMVRRRVHRILIVEGGRLVGLLSAWELLRRTIEVRLMTPIVEIMTTPVVTAGPDQRTEVAIERLRRNDIHGLVVVHHGWPVGIFGQREALQAELHPERDRLDLWLSPGILTMPPDFPVHHAAAQALATGARYLVVVDGRSIRGLLTPTDFARLQDKS